MAKDRSEYMKAYYQANKERLLENNRRWRAENPEKNREIGRRSMKRYREKQRENQIISPDLADSLRRLGGGGK